MIKIKVTLRPKEYGTLMDLMKVVILPQSAGLASRLVICLLQGVYTRMKVEGIFIKEKYKVTMTLPEALAFQEFWTGQPMAGMVSSAVINRIIGVIDQKTTSISVIL